MNANPYQPFFNKLDEVLADDGLHADARDLLTRAGYVIANLLNAQAQLYPHLILDPVPAPTEADGAEGTSLEPSESLARDDP